jgi:hypothetical protein
MGLGHVPGRGLTPTNHNWRIGFSFASNTGTARYRVDREGCSRFLIEAPVTEVEDRASVMVMKRN